jgi:hypothetical protein
MPIPENGSLAIVLRGDLAAMLAFAANKKTRRQSKTPRPDWRGRFCLMSVEREGGWLRE